MRLWRNPISIQLGVASQLLPKRLRRGRGALAGARTLDGARHPCLISATAVLCLALGACAKTPDALVVRAASIDAGVLNAHVEWQPDPSVLEALDHGIALDFAVTVQAQTVAGIGWHRTLVSQQHHLQLRYFPLSRQYQLRDFESDQTRSYAARALALAALEDLRLSLPGWNAAGAQRFLVEIALDRDALPGTLRLAALLRPAWRLSGEYVWPAPAG